MNEDLINLNIMLSSIYKQLNIMNKLKTYELQNVYNCDREEINKILGKG